MAFDKTNSESRQPDSDNTDKQRNAKRTGEPDSTPPSQQEYKNIETSVNSPSYFDDDYEVKQEDKISSEEAKTEGS